jgi:hypothetical protein
MKAKRLLATLQRSYHKALDCLPTVDAYWTQSSLNPVHTSDWYAPSGHHLIYKLANETLRTISAEIEPGSSVTDFDVNKITIPLLPKLALALNAFSRVNWPDLDKIIKREGMWETDSKQPVKQSSGSFKINKTNVPPNEMGEFSVREDRIERPDNLFDQTKDLQGATEKVIKARLNEDKEREIDSVISENNKRKLPLKEEIKGRKGVGGRPRTLDDLRQFIKEKGSQLSGYSQKEVARLFNEEFPEREPKVTSKNVSDAKRR